MNVVFVLTLLLGCILSVIWYITHHMVVERYTSDRNSYRNGMTTERKVLRAMENIIHTQISNETRFIQAPQFSFKYPLRLGGFFNPWSKMKSNCKKQRKFKNIHVDKINPKRKRGSINFKSRVNVNDVKAKSLKLNNQTFFRSTKDGLIIGNSAPNFKNRLTRAIQKQMRNQVDKFKTLQTPKYRSNWMVG